jgi:drug/metabolite transporter (DMT)-like permease
MQCSLHSQNDRIILRNQDSFMKPTELTPKRLKLGIAITIVACLFFAAASALVYNFRGRFPTIQIIFIQNIVSLFCILPLALRKGFKRLKTAELPLHFLRDAMGVGSYFLYFLAIRSLNLVDATTLNYTMPFFIPFIWLVWQKEKIQAAVWWSIIVGFIGVAIILNPSKDIFQLGFLYGLFAGICSALATAALRVLNVKKEPLSRTLFYYFSLGTMLSFPFAWAVWVQPVEEEWLFAIGIGAATAIGQILYTIAYRYGTASFLSPLGYMTVIYNVLITWFAFDQELGWRSIVGSALIIVGGTMTYIFKKQPVTVLETFEHPDQKTKPPL